MRVTITILLLIVSLLTCTRKGTSFAVQIVPAQRLSTPVGAYLDVTWLSDEQLIVSYEPNLDSQKWTHRLWSLRIDSTDMHPLDLPENPKECSRTEFRYPQAMQDNRLVYMRVCQPHERWWHSTPYALVWNLRSKTSHLARDYELSSDIATFTFTPDLSRGLLATATGIEDELYWLDQDTARPLRLGFARAGSPAWSPDRATIVFFGSQTLRGRPGPQWVDQPDDLWLMPADCKNRASGCVESVDVILHNIVYPGRVRWSPDSLWLAFNGILNEGERGVWLRHMETGKVYQIAQGDYRAPAWSPDGQQIVVIGPPAGTDEIDAFDNRSALYILDVSDIVAP